jgi:CheY-like chemotaxis protein
VTAAEPRPWVLIVDDDEDIRDTIRSLLQLRGYIVDTAPDGRVGLERMRTAHPPALVILDYMMPGMNGEEFREAQLADPELARVPVVLLTGAGDVGSAAHVDIERMAKPIELQLLFETVARYCTKGST